MGGDPPALVPQRGPGALCSVTGATGSWRRAAKIRVCEAEILLRERTKAASAVHCELEHQGRRKGQGQGLANGRNNVLIAGAHRQHKIRRLLVRITFRVGRYLSCSSGRLLLWTLWASFGGTDISLAFSNLVRARKGVTNCTSIRHLLHRC